jgi:hypothetical protein
MLTFEDCLALAGLSREEAAAIAAHEGLPATVAVELGSYLRRCPGGEHCILTMIRGELEAARARGDGASTVRLRRLLRGTAAAGGDAPPSSPCLPKLLFPGGKELRMRACAICDRHRAGDPRP